MDVITEALRANPEFKTGLLSALNLAEQPAAAQPSEPGAATVTAGRDQKFRGNVNIGSGVLTVNRQRTIRLGLGSALAVLLVGSVTTGVVYLRQGDRAAPQSVDSPPAVSSPIAAKPLSTVPPNSLDTSIATIKMTNYAHDDTTIYGFISDSSSEVPEPDLTATAIATGQPRWSVRLPDNGVASNNERWTPTLVTGNGKTLVATPYYGTVPGHGTTPGHEYIGVMAADSQTGSVAWHVEVQQFQQNSMEMLPTGSLIGGGSVLAVSWEGPTGDGLAPQSPNTSAVVDATNGKVLKLELQKGLQKIFYDKAQSDEKTIILEGEGIAAYDATSFQRLWALPDPAANRVSLDSIGALWNGALYGNGADNLPAMLDARTGADKTATLPCVPTVLVPGYALCGGNDYQVQVYPIK
ncbi:MAG: hypothetical protein ACRDRS_08290 [Pseudonocardiaceae bacterium]